MDRTRHGRLGMAPTHVGIDRRPTRTLSEGARAPQGRLVGRRVPRRGTVRFRRLARLDRRSCGRPSPRAGVPRASRRLRTRAPPRRRQRDQRMDAGCAAGRVGPLTRWVTKAQGASVRRRSPAITAEQRLDRLAQARILRGRWSGSSPAPADVASARWHTSAPRRSRPVVGRRRSGRTPAT